MVWLALASSGFVLTLTGTAVVRRYAVRTRLMDIPNARSSHSVAVPRGGGIAFVASFLAMLSLGLLLDGLAARLVIGFAGAAALVAAIGLLDDRYQLPAKWRLLGHLLAAIWVLSWCGGAPTLSMFGWTMASSAWSMLLFALLVAWLLNLYNFMDGIDGIAASQAVLVAGLGAGFWWLGDPAGSWPAAVLFAACVAGFLPWNLPPARIFMGDAGSGFLGLMIGVLAIESSRADPQLLWIWLILTNGFVVDATTTLFTRLVTGQRAHEAHRSHAYQHLSQRLQAHRPVTLLYCAAIVVWLLPIAWCVHAGWLDGSVGWLISATPLLLIAVKCRAGRA